VGDPLRVIVVDDEPLARSGLADLVRRDPDLLVVEECGDGRAAVEAIRRLAPDLVLLDVQMPELNGFEVLQQLAPERLPAVVFVTAYDRFAVQAFEVHALDYLIKPFDDDRFRAAMARAKETVRGAAIGELSRRLLGLLDHVPQATSATGRFLTRIVIRVAGHVFFVRTSDIDWIEAADYCVRLHVQGKTHVVRESMAGLENRLDPAHFFRIHRGAIANLDRIKELQPYFKGEHIVVLQDGTRLKLSKSRRTSLETRLGQSL
jgi:two-component system LytT family response regulator